LNRVKRGKGLEECCDVIDSGHPLVMRNSHAVNHGNELLFRVGPIGFRLLPKP